MDTLRQPPRHFQQSPLGLPRNHAGVSWNLHLLSSPFGPKTRTFLETNTESFKDSSCLSLLGSVLCVACCLYTKWKKIEMIIHGGHRWRDASCSLGLGALRLLMQPADTPTQPTHHARAWVLGHQASGWLWNTDVSCEIRDNLGLKAAGIKSFSFYCKSQKDRLLAAAEGRSLQL